MSFEPTSQKGERVAALLLVGFQKRQQRLDEASAVRTFSCKGEVPPNDCMTQLALACVVRRLNRLVAQEHPQLPAMTVHSLHVHRAAP